MDFSTSVYKTFWLISLTKQSQIKLSFQAFFLEVPTSSTWSLLSCHEDGFVDSVAVLTSSIASVMNEINLE